jgi:hypothetical protein
VGQGRVRAILTNPKYTGYQVWNRQRTDEVLLDVENVALGHTAKQRWNPADKRVVSDQAAHPLIITKEDFELTQATLAGRGSKTQHKEHRRPRSYALRGVMLCGTRPRRPADAPARRGPANGQRRRRVVGQRQDGPQFRWGDEASRLAIPGTEAVSPLHEGDVRIS